MCNPQEYFFNKASIYLTLQRAEALYFWQVYKKSNKRVRGNLPELFVYPLFKMLSHLYTPAGMLKIDNSKLPKMSTSCIDHELNAEQQTAASTIHGPLLIIAGAGSGKTKTITCRIAHMLNQGIPQSAILALTFTNKAAKEMQHRIRTFTGKKLTNLTLSTFHAFGVIILRESIKELGYTDNFSIYDQTDKISLLKEVTRAMKISPDNIDFFYTANLFSGIKTGRINWDTDILPLQSIYQEYQEHLKTYNAVDFDDLIMLPIALFEQHPNILEKYRNRYKFIMVDEFQDTSLAQYRIVKYLAEVSRNLCVVGDDDQSIYSWRGANYLNITAFEKDFPERLEIKLEQNYRSTGNILAAANKLISHNRRRKDKNLWTGLGTGNPIEVYFPEDEKQEASFIVRMIRNIAAHENLGYNNFGILVRTNTLTTAIENELLTENIPYHVSGGQSFFQRKEIKDIIAYLRVLVNPDDDVNLLRIINTPRRGIGRTGLQQVRDLAREKGWSLYSAVSALRWAEDAPINPKTLASLADFVTLLEYYRELLFQKKGLSKLVASLVDQIDYWGFLIQEHQTNDSLAKWKYKNIQIFQEIIDNWEHDPDTIDTSLYAFLNKITLVTREDDENGEHDKKKGKINLMTIHAAKGLEFNTVFLAGVESHIIPHARAIDENEDNIEEERRLFYVAITRAQKKLFMTSCRSRKVLRDVIETSPSPFLDEIPQTLLQVHEEPEEVSPREADAFFAKIRSQFT